MSSTLIPDNGNVLAVGAACEAKHLFVNKRADNKSIAF
jgi:hypothetical protein